MFEVTISEKDTLPTANICIYRILGSVLSDERFMKMSRDYELEQQKTNVKAFIATVKKYTDSVAYEKEIQILFIFS